MPIQETNEDIPTLTQIIQSGDASMENHFDASYFDDDNGLFDDNNGLDIVEENTIQEDITVTENDSSHEAVEEPFIKTAEEIASEVDVEEENIKEAISLSADNDLSVAEDNTAPEINSITDDFSSQEPETESLQEKPDGSIDETELHATIDLLISDAVKEVLPSVEKLLTEELSKQIYQKLFPEK
jgi:hypothetical protein